ALARRVRWRCWWRRLAGCRRRMTDRVAPKAIGPPDARRCRSDPRRHIRQLCAPAVSDNRVLTRREAWPGAGQRLLSDAEIGDGEVPRVMLHELEHPCPPTILSKSGLNVCFWHKADMATASGDVRFRVNSGH